MYDKIIAISREFGSGGRTVGKMVAERLKIPCYDGEIVDRVAADSGFIKTQIEEKGEYLSAAGKISTAFTLYNLYSNMNKEDVIWNAQVKVVKELAEKGPCVIVGRCADYILRERDDVIRVFICADIKSRAERIVRVYGERKDSPEKRLKDKDKKRSAYYKYYTETEWGDPRFHDLCLNSGILGIEKCVDIIVNL